MVDDFDQITAEEFYNEADDILTLPVEADDDETPSDRRIRFDRLITEWSKRKDEEFNGKDYTAGYLISLVATLLTSHIDKKSAEDIAATHFGKEE